MNLAAYARYSSDNQKVESIEEQFREIDEWAERNNYVIAKKYSDYALSGKYDYRPEFELMLQDAKNGAFDGVVVFDLSRFSRGGEYGIVDALRLEECGVRLLSVTENYSNDFGGKLIKHVKFLMAEEKIEELRVNVARGQRDNALKCKHNGGTPPLGYDVDKDGYLIINEREAEAVRLIFTMYANRQPYSAICAALNARGYKTKRSCSDFGKNSIHDILTNKKYIGVYEFGKIQRIKLRGSDFGAQKSRTVERKDHVIIEGGCPAIINNDLWDKVQSMKVKREVFNPKAKVEYLLKGKVYCGVCGSAYWGNGASKRYLNDYYYVCSGKKSKKDCTSCKVPKNKLEEDVTAQVRAMLFSAQGKEQLKKYILAINEASRTVDKKAIKEYEDKIKVIESRLARAQEAYISGVIELDALRRIKQNEEQKKRELVPPPDGQVLDITDDRLEHIMTRLEKTLSEDKDLIAALIDKVIITGNKIDVYIYKNFLFDAKTENDASIVPAPSIGDCVVEIRRHRDYPRKLLLINNNIIVSYIYN